ncbi:MAG: bifunctional metallophosphatase/5'-nucleotidase [Acidobacteria bacterium]|nr:bifunctional metallophosphatase/5'-nucleotidase [Acidobacteriota bacterium]
MANRILLVLLAGMAARIAADPTPAAQQSPEAARPVTISIVGTNDLHGGAVARREGRGGLALFAGYLKNLREARARGRGGVVLVDAGDMFQGTLESNLNEGAVIVRAYNALGYTAAAIGNHEFDFGPAGEGATPRRPSDDPQGALKARAAEARFPFLSANVLDVSTRRVVAWTNVMPWTTVDVAGVKVGLIGVTTEETPDTTIAANFAGLRMRPIVGAIAEGAAAVRRAGATLVVVAAHEGGRCTAFDKPDETSSCRQDEPIMQVARKLPRGTVDVIVAGHSHAGMAHRVSGLAIIESFSSGVAFGRVDVEVDRRSGRLLSTTILPPRDICASEDPATRSCDPARVAGKTLVPVVYEGRRVEADAGINEILRPAVDAARAIKERTLGVTIETAITRAYDQESALGNLFTDLTRAARADADVAVANGGGLRTDLPAGELIYGQLYEATPFDNQLVAIRLTGRQLRAVVTANLKASGSFLSVSGVSVKARCDEGARALTVSLMRPDGRSIADDEMLTVVTSDFLATGGDGFLAPAGKFATAPGSEGVILRDAMAAELTKRGGRLRADALFDPKNPRVAFPGRRPVQCQ